MDMQFNSLEEVESAIVQSMAKKSQCGKLGNVATCVISTFTYCLLLGSCHPEGFVIRTMSGFTYDSLESHTAKYVRAGHVQTEESWRRTWKQAKLLKL